MLVNIIRIGNSKGIRLPRKILDQCHIDDQIDLKVKEDTIILTPVRKKPREDWEEMAEKMHELHDDELIIPDIFVDEEHPEW